jgi:hypothetical protein
MLLHNGLVTATRTSCGAVLQSLGFAAGYAVAILDSQIFYHRVTLYLHNFLLWSAMACMRSGGWQLWWCVIVVQVRQLLISGAASYCPNLAQVT